MPKIVSEDSVGSQASWSDNLLAGLLTGLKVAKAWSWRKQWRVRYHGKQMISEFNFQKKPSTQVVTRLCVFTTSPHRYEFSSWSTHKNSEAPASAVPPSALHLHEARSDAFAGTLARVWLLSLVPWRNCNDMQAQFAKNDREAEVNNSANVTRLNILWYCIASIHYCENKVQCSIYGNNLQIITITITYKNKPCVVKFIISTWYTVPDWKQLRFECNCCIDACESHTLGFLSILVGGNYFSHHLHHMQPLRGERLVDVVDITCIQ